MSEHPARHDIASRLAELHASDPEFARAAPSPDVARTVRRSAGSLVGTMAAAMRGYADRPALAHRAHHVVRDGATGERVLELLPSFETLTYAELWQRVGTLSTAWADPACGLRPGDFVAMLGSTGVDHATIDLACLYLGAVSVPLPSDGPRHAWHRSSPKRARGSSQPTSVRSTRRSRPSWRPAPSTAWSSSTAIHAWTATGTPFGTPSTS